jgi:serine protease Do
MKTTTFTLFISFTWLLMGCVASAPSIKYASGSRVTVGHVNLGMSPTLTPQARDLAESHCRSVGKTAVYTGNIRDSGVGPEEFDFNCIDDKSDRPPPIAAVKRRVAPEPNAESNSTPNTKTSGSGFFVSRLGHLLTNQHVVNGCRSVTVGDNADGKNRAEIVDIDKRNDLALLKLSSLNSASAETKSLVMKLGLIVSEKSIPLSSDGLLRSEDVELGETVMVSGYPYGEIFSDTVKVTGGMVSAVRGMGDDKGQFQIDAAVQPGNSGGPIYDEKGNIVGVVVSQLNKMKVAKAIGSLPENVNFGIKASVVRRFLNSAGLPTKWSERSQPMSTRDLAKIAKNQTLIVFCHR